MNILKKWRIIYSALLFTALIFLGSCTSVMGPGYYSQMIYGEVKILASRTPITELLADKNTSEELKQNLRYVQEMRKFAIYELSLPVSESYTTYVDTGRKYATWALTATPEFSVNPKMWYYPIVGYTSYLGFFDEKRAERVKNKLVRNGYDVSLRGVTAFSTVGWFADPLMNTHFGRSLPSLAGTVFHETSHEVLYIKSDTKYNEAFATFVGHTGQYLWIAKHYGKEEAEKFLVHEKRSDEFSALFVNTKKELRELYKKNFPSEKMRILKKEAFNEMRAKYAELKKTWGGYSGYDIYVAGPLNNADIIGEDEYKNLIPFFQKLFDLSGKNFPAFYEQAKKIANLPKLYRYLEIERIMKK